MRSLIRSLHSEMGMTVVMATHDLTDALALADRVAVIADGRVVQHGTVDEVILKPSNLFVASFSGLRNIMRASFEGTVARVGELKIILAGPAAGTGCIAVPPEAVTLSQDPPGFQPEELLPRHRPVSRAGVTCRYRQRRSRVGPVRGRDHAGVHRKTRPAGRFACLGLVQGQLGPYPHLKIRPLQEIPDNPRLRPTSHISA